MNDECKPEIKQELREGLLDGLPVGAGYFAVAFSLGIEAVKAGLNPFEGFFSSFLNHASAGEYALYSGIKDGLYFAEIALITLVVNARYLLMSCSLSQKLSVQTGIFHRILMGFGITDEIFGLAISRKKLTPVYYYGAMFLAVFLWSLGTACGIFAGNILPDSVVKALSVALYGMFIAIIIPPAKKNPFTGIVVAVSFGLSFLCTKLPVIQELSAGNRTIILTVLISAAAALIKPVKDEENSDGGERD